MTSHPLFAAYPETGRRTVRGVEEPVPYHVSEGHAALVTGQASADQVAKAAQVPGWHPVHDTSGAAACGVFICRFDKANLGPHLELHFGVLAAPKAREVIADTPEAFLAAFGTRTDWGFLSLGLWNDTQRVVAYNADLLGLPAALAQGEITFDPTKMPFSFAKPDGTNIAKGQVRLPKAASVGSMFSLLRLMGLRAFIAAARAKWATAHVIHPDGRRALTATAADKVTVARTGSGDRMDFSNGPLAAYDFRPKVVQHMSPFRFVYSEPLAS